MFMEARSYQASGGFNMSSKQNNFQQLFNLNSKNNPKIKSKIRSQSYNHHSNNVFSSNLNPNNLGNISNNVNHNPIRGHSNNTQDMNLETNSNS